MKILSWHMKEPVMNPVNAITLLTILFVEEIIKIMGMNAILDVLA